MTLQGAATLCLPLLSCPFMLVTLGSAAFLQTRHREGLPWDSEAHSINEFDDHVQSWKFEASGLYYELATSEGEKVWSGKVEGKIGSWADSETAFDLASASKLFTGFAAMRTMELRPNLFYGDRFVHEFKGWEEFKNFPIENSSKRANLTIKHLLTHTSGLPFAMRSSWEDIMKLTLFYEPGTKFGYTLGHRVIGWLLRDFWKEQTNGNLHSVQGVFKWLVFDKLGLSKQTKFDTSLKKVFGVTGNAGDAAIQSTGEDMMKLAVVALRRGKTLSGEVLISEDHWNSWAVPNLLPDGKLSKDLTDWHAGAVNWDNWNVGGAKENIMRQSGDYGWNYFGATYHDSREIGWCGFFSSCLRVSYPRDIALVMMQRDIADLKKSKPYIVENFDEIAKSLQCTKEGCRKQSGSPSVLCEECTYKFWFFGNRSCANTALSDSCPSRSAAGKLWTDTRLDNDNHACYVPRCDA